MLTRIAVWIMRRLSTVYVHELLSERRRAEMLAASRVIHREVCELCALGDLPPEFAREMIEHGLPPDVVRRDLVRMTQTRPS